jgi:hypothetical protein
VAASFANGVELAPDGSIEIMLLIILVMIVVAFRLAFK